MSILLNAYYAELMDEPQVADLLIRTAQVEPGNIAPINMAVNSIFAKLEWNRWLSENDNWKNPKNITKALTDNGFDVIAKDPKAVKTIIKTLDIHGIPKPQSFYKALSDLGVNLQNDKVFDQAGNLYKAAPKNVAKSIGKLSQEQIAKIQQIAQEVANNPQIIKTQFAEKVAEAARNQLAPLANAINDVKSAQGALNTLKSIGGGSLKVLGTGLMKVLGPAACAWTVYDIYNKSNSGEMITPDDIAGLMMVIPSPYVQAASFTFMAVYNATDFILSKSGIKDELEKVGMNIGEHLGDTDGILAAQETGIVRDDREKQLVMSVGQKAQELKQQGNLLPYLTAKKEILNQLRTMNLDLPTMTRIFSAIDHHFPDLAEMDHQTWQELTPEQRKQTLSNQPMTPATQKVTPPTQTVSNSALLLQRGLRNDDVARWQKFLISKQLLSPLDQASLGIFGPKTEAATRQFQQQSQIRVDGIVGPETKQAAGLN